MKKPNLTNLETMLKIQDLLKQLPSDCLVTVSKMVREQQKKKARSLSNKGSFAGFRIGEKVQFGRPQGRKHQGVILKLNPAKAVIKENTGTQWRVPYTLISEVA